MENSTKKQKETEYIVSENQEVALGGQEGWTHRFVSAFPALAHKNYRIYFSGQLVSLIGFWLQQVALGWLVLQLTNSPFWVGFVSMMNNLPILFFGLFAGVIVDRFDTKKLLFLTQVSAMVCVFTLGLLTATNNISLFSINLLVFLLGTIAALDLPARQSFAVEMVGKKDLSSAVALNAGLFNGARVIGPAVSGFLIAVVGIGGSFIINAITYIPIIVALWFVKVATEASHVHPHPISAVKEGIHYSFSHKVIRPFLILAAIISIFGWSYVIVMPVIVKDIYHEGVSVLGHLFAISGIGALLGTIIVSSLFRKVNPIAIVIFGNFIFSLAIIMFSFSPSVIFAIPFLFLMGLGLLLMFATMNSIIQHMVRDDIRGRVLSIYVLMFAGTTPFGSFIAGLLAEKVDPLFAVRVGGLMVFISGLYIFFGRKKLSKEYKEKFISHSS